MSSTARRQNVCAIVGDIDPKVLDQIVASDATLSEISLAVSEIEEQLGFDEHTSSRSPRVAKLHELLEPFFQQRDNISRGRD